MRQSTMAQPGSSRWASNSAGWISVLYTLTPDPSPSRERGARKPQALNCVPPPCRERGTRYPGSTRVAVAAAVLLCAVDGEDARRNDDHAGQKPRDPFLPHLRLVHLHRVRRATRKMGERDVADPHLRAPLEQLLQCHVVEHELTRLHMRIDVPDGGGLGQRIGELERFTKLVLGPNRITEDERSGGATIHDDAGEIPIFEAVRLLCRGQPDSGAGRRKVVVSAHPVAHPAG